MGRKKNDVSISTKSIPIRKIFHSMIKEPKETHEEWLIRVKELAESCEFGQNINLFVLDKFLSGLETEMIDHLCLSAVCLTINSSLQIINEFGTEQMKTETNVHISDIKSEAVLPEMVEIPETVFSEIEIVKYDPDGNDDISNDDHDYVVDNDSFDNNIINSDIEDILPNRRKSIRKSSKPARRTKTKKQLKNEQINDYLGDSDLDDLDDVFDNNAKDSDFQCSDFEDTLPKKRIPTKKESKPKRKTKKELKKERKDENRTDKANADPNAPKKKRKYKKRAVKEKQWFECEICHYKVNHECHLRRHKLIHMNQKSFICHVCGKGFNLSINLNAHLRRHAGYKPHSCDVCNASFLDRTRLRLHMRTHTGERPFGCNFCDKRFADRYYMKVHMRLHTGERPFKCEICQKTFSQSSSLSLHKKKNCLVNPAVKNTMHNFHS